MLQKTPKISQDVHVEPFWKRCDMCNLNYDIIGKMETFTKDSNYILENTGMNASKINVEEKVDWLLSLLRFEFQAGHSNRNKIHPSDLSILSDEQTAKEFLKNYIAISFLWLEF